MFMSRGALAISIYIYLECVHASRAACFSNLLHYLRRLVEAIAAAAAALVLANVHRQAPDIPQPASHKECHKTSDSVSWRAIHAFGEGECDMPSGEPDRRDSYASIKTTHSPMDVCVYITDGSAVPQLIRCEIFKEFV